MRKESWLIVFFIALAADTILTVTIIPTFYRIFSKPLIVLSLLIYFELATAGINSTIKKWIIASLFLSIAGDILLLFETNASMFFIAGLVAFLIAHVCYIIAFNKIRISEQVRFKPTLLLPTLLYYFALMIILFPSLGPMKIPVAVYGLVICIMLGMALQLLRLQNRLMAGMLLAGAVLFIASDSMLAFNKFYAPWQYAGVLIMLTYGLAQFFVTISCCKTIARGKNLDRTIALAH